MSSVPVWRTSDSDFFLQIESPSGPPAPASPPGAVSNRARPTACAPDRSRFRAYENTEGIETERLGTFGGPSVKGCVRVTHQYA